MRIISECQSPKWVYFVTVRGHMLWCEFQRLQWRFTWKSEATLRFICECQRPQSGFYVSIKVTVREVFESGQGKILCDCHGNSECTMWVSEDTGYYVKVKDHSEHIVSQRAQWGFYVNFWGLTDDIISVSEGRLCLLYVRGLREDTQWMTVVTMVTLRIL